MLYLKDQKIIGLAMEGIELCRSGELCLVQVKLRILSSVLKYIYCIYLQFREHDLIIISFCRYQQRSTTWSSMLSNSGETIYLKMDSETYYRVRRLWRLARGCRVPTQTGKMGRHAIFQSGKSQGILNRLEKSGKITQNTGKLREFEINIVWYF